MSTLALDESEWNFSKDRVPESEVIGCCLWEYARESPFIRDVRRRCLESRHEGQGNDVLYCDTEKLQSIGHTANVFLRGFYLEPNIEYQSCDDTLPTWRHPEASPITGNFPIAWQKLSSEERAYRSQISSDRNLIPLVPFKRGESFDARDITNFCEARRKEIFAHYDDVRRKHPDTSEVELVEAGILQPFPGISPSLYWEGGREVSVVAIQWSEFTDDEIATYFRKWVKENRPDHYPAPSGKGKKLNDWRIALTRLGIVRALHEVTFADLRFPEVFRERGEKYCYSARKLVLTKFHKLFPFLPNGERPLSWETRGRKSG